MMILGISAYYHDSAAALLEDGKIVAAVQEERLSRKKHDPRFPQNAVSWCLSNAGVPLSELDYVVFYDKPWIKFERILETYPWSRKASNKRTSTIIRFSSRPAGC